ncbi:hypothetical protein OHA18_16880 [Kribbella sp. NBC_00709]|uniref:hypothetical protein n=1 Tax=Kribbella sp. NBC_00709 TaxID=2975972 RepID=UPI002E2DE0EC|nr:hypothetical protein [Kribbella sp. NBC_00709]
MTFRTGRVRPLVVAVIATLLTVALVPWQPDFGEYPVTEAILAVLAATCLFFAVRSWRAVLRGPIGLRMTPAELTVTRRGREVNIPWLEVADIRIDGGPKRSWVVAHLTPAIDPADVPVSRRRDGSYLLFPVAHGRSGKRRAKSRRQLRDAIQLNGLRYLDVV